MKLKSLIFFLGLSVLNKQVVAQDPLSSGACQGDLNTCEVEGNICIQRIVKSVRNVDTDEYIARLALDPLLNKGDVYLGCYSPEQAATYLAVSGNFDMQTGMKLEFVDMAAAALAAAEAANPSLEDQIAASIAQAQVEAQILVAELEAQQEAARLEALNTQQWDYTLNGADWPENYPGCTLTNQSPIDLPSEGLPRFKASKDQFNKFYTNQNVNITVQWAEKSTNRVAIDKEGQDLQIMSSGFSPLVLGGSDRFQGKMFQFHSGSMHTIDGIRQDLELDIIHQAMTSGTDVPLSAMGILFSVNDFTAKLNPIEIKIIDDFFESLQWDTEEQDYLVQDVKFGDMMNMIDMTRRWAYTGSAPVPPCEQGVYWNVLKTVYPIKQAHLDQYKGQLTRNQQEYDLTSVGNWRVTQDLTYEHNLQEIVQPEVYNQLIEELIREYLLYNGYTGTLDNLQNESPSIDSSVSLTRIDMIDNADITVTSQSSPLIYDLAMRDSDVEQVYVPPTDE